MQCEKCRRRLRPVRRDYPYPESGLRIVLAGAPVYVCPQHGVQGVLLRNLPGIHAAIARAILHGPGPLAGPAIRFLRKHRGWSQAALARRLGVHEVTVAKWETEVAPVGPANQQRLRLLFTDPAAFEASRVASRPRGKAAATIRIRLPRRGHKEQRAAVA